MDSSTIIRRVTITAMVVGPRNDIVNRIVDSFELTRMQVVRASTAAAAGERLALAMPQVVVVVGALGADERDALTDRATAVGAFVMYVDPERDGETIEDIVARASRAAVERKLARDESGPAGEVAEATPPPPPADEDVDSKW